ncbi:MAG: 30S ribosomal protein S30e [Candidatus Nitrosocaldus sp.]|nr:30S ribosomal protein S30e [Candidatus Nitrosocaldus sp.]MDW8000449.1 30S ribosomal protein S30e [Candidatus Nitrosocaldus sp.]
MPTHGSITKAGKVKSQTPKLQARPKESPIPKVRNRSNYVKRFKHNRKPGQNWDLMGSSSSGSGAR